MDILIQQQYNEVLQKERITLIFQNLKQVEY